MPSDTDADGPPEFGEPIVLERTGSPPIKFHGKLLVEGTTVTDKKDDRGHAVRIYETRTQEGCPRYVVQIEYLTKWKSEATGHIVLVADSGRELAIKLLAHDPMYFVVGYPPGERFDEKRHRLAATIRHQYMALVSRLLVQVPDAAESLGPSGGV